MATSGDYRRHFVADGRRYGHILDVRTGRQIWRYQYPSNEGFHIGHRGVAVHGRSVFLTTPDAHLVSLDAATGTVNWTVAIADSKRGYWSTMAPLVVRDHAVQGERGTRR